MAKQFCDKCKKDGIHKIGNKYYCDKHRPIVFLDLEVEQNCSWQKSSEDNPLHLEDCLDYDIKYYERPVEFPDEWHKYYTEIIDYNIKSVDILALVDVITNENNKFRDELFVYCVDRILRSMQIYETTKWSLDYGHYYYGDQVFGAEVDNPQTIDEAVLACWLSQDRVEYILDKEYGYLLDDAQNCVWEVVEVPKKDIYRNSQHYKKISHVDYYEDYPYYVGVALEKNGRIELIDGYHRLTSMKGEGKNKKLKVILGKKKA